MGYGVRGRQQSQELARRAQEDVGMRGCMGAANSDRGSVPRQRLMVSKADCEHPGKLQGCEYWEKEWVRHRSQEM